MINFSDRTSLLIFSLSGSAVAWFTVPFLLRFLSKQVSRHLVDLSSYVSFHYNGFFLNLCRLPYEFKTATRKINSTG